MLTFQIFIALWSNFFDYKNQFSEILDDSSDFARKIEQVEAGQF